MGDSYREELKKRQKKSGFAVETPQEAREIRRRALRNKYNGKPRSRHRSVAETAKQLRLF